MRRVGDCHPFDCAQGGLARNDGAVGVAVPATAKRRGLHLEGTRKHVRGCGDCHVASLLAMTTGAVARRRNNE